MNFRQLLTFLLLTLASCSGPPAPVGSQEPGTVPTTGMSTVAITIPPDAMTLGASAFGDPANADIGATVIWFNNDTIAHTVTADDGSFDSGIIAPGASFSRAFSAPGPVNYHCSIHPTMKGVLTINGSTPTAPNPLPAPSLGVPRS